MQVTEEDNKKCVSKLSVWFHTDVLKRLLESNYVDNKAEVFVKQLLDSLESLKPSTSIWYLKRKKAKEEKDKSKRRTLFSCFHQGEMETTTESAASCESSFADSDCLCQLDLFLFSQ